MSFGSYFEAENIYQATLTFHYLAKMFGLASYSIIEWERNLKTSIFDFVILGSTVLFWCGITIYKIWYIINDHVDSGAYKESSFLGGIMNLSFIVQVTLSIFLFLFNHFKWHHIRKMLKYFDDFDRKLRNEHWLHQVKSSRFYFILFAVFIVFNIILTFLLVLFPDYGDVQVPLFAYSNIVYMIVSGQFILALIAATNRIKTLFANVE